MPTDTPETKVENLKVHAFAKTKVLKVVQAIGDERNGFAPTLTEAVAIMADHYLTTRGHAQAA